MKKLFFLYFFCLFSNILFGNTLTIGSINNNGQEIYNNSNLKMIVYYIPFSGLYRSALSMEQIKNNYLLKIEIKGETKIYNFIKSLENTQYEIIENNGNNDFRCVLEFFYNDNIIFSYGLTGFHVIINGERILNDMRFYRIILPFLPREYEYDLEFINR